MAKMGRRKRSRLTTEAFLTGGSPAGSERAQAKKNKRAEANAERVESEAAEAKAERAEAKSAPAAAAKPVAQAAAGALDLAALADKVKARRKEMGWTQGDVAKKGGPAAGMISQIERSLVEAPAADVLTKLDAGLEWPTSTSDAILHGRVPVGA